jgi:hypothetical protein
MNRGTEQNIRFFLYYIANTAVITSYSNLFFGEKEEQNIYEDDDAWCVLLLIQDLSSQSFLKSLSTVRVVFA